MIILRQTSYSDLEPFNRSEHMKQLQLTSYKNTPKPKLLKGTSTKYIKG